MNEWFRPWIRGGSLFFLILLASGTACFGDEHSGPPAPAIPDMKVVADGRQLFLMNCAHCHGSDARGDEGPDLHGVVKSDAHIAALIMDGKKGEMPKFRAKFSTNDVTALIAYIRSLE